MENTDKFYVPFGYGVTELLDEGEYNGLKSGLREL